MLGCVAGAAALFSCGSEPYGQLGTSGGTPAFVPMPIKL
jgi:hypothetical protein